jgi:hypothetical protein
MVGIGTTVSVKVVELEQFKPFEPFKVYIEVATGDTTSVVVVAPPGFQV